MIPGGFHFLISAKFNVMPQELDMAGFFEKSYSVNMSVSQSRSPLPGRRRAANRRQSSAQRTDRRFHPDNKRYLSHFLPQVTRMRTAEL